MTNNADIDATVRKLRNHGSNARNVHSFGFNSRLDDLHAGVLSAKLKHIDEWNDQRRKWAARYTAGLKGCKNFDSPYEMPGYRHVFHLYVIETKKPSGAIRCGFPRQERHRRQDALLDRHPPAGRLSVGQRRAHRRAGCQRRAQRGHAASRLPMFPELTAEEVDYVIAKVHTSGTRASSGMAE